MARGSSIGETGRRRLSCRCAWCRAALGMRCQPTQVRFIIKLCISIMQIQHSICHVFSTVAIRLSYLFGRSATLRMVCRPLSAMASLYRKVCRLSERCNTLCAIHFGRIEESCSLCRAVGPVDGGARNLQGPHVPAGHLLDAQCLGRLFLQLPQPHLWPHCQHRHWH